MGVSLLGDADCDGARTPVADEVAKNLDHPQHRNTASTPDRNTPLICPSSGGTLVVVGFWEGG